MMCENQALRFIHCFRSLKNITEVTSSQNSEILIWTVALGFLCSQASVDGFHAILG